MAEQTKQDERTAAFVAIDKQLDQMEADFEMHVRWMEKHQRTMVDLRQKLQQLKPPTSESVK